MENQKDFCTECRRETSYTLKEIDEQYHGIRT